MRIILLSPDALRTVTSTGSAQRALFMKKQPKALARRSGLAFVLTIVLFLFWGLARSEGTSDFHVPPAGSDRLQDVRIVKQRLNNIFLAEARIDAKAVQTMLQRLQADGSWPDIDYAAPGAHRNERHLRRVIQLARAWKSVDSPVKGDQEVKRAALKGLNYWLTNDFRNPGFSNVIGVPLSVSKAMLILDGQLSAQQLAKGLMILRRAELAGRKVSGQNLVWIAQINARRGLLKNDPALAALAFRYIEQEMRLTSGEGIQHDFSFHQHGTFYSFGYGYGTTTDMSRLANLVAGTQFAMSPGTITVFNAFLLDGQRWMIRGKTADYGAMGRWIARQRSNSTPLAKACRLMLPLAAERKDELQHLIDHIEHGAPDPLSGNKHFWRSDFMSHHRKGYYTSARMYSARIRNTDEAHHGEGIKSHHIADGANFLFITGEEYRGLAPVWDWQKIPGTTVVQTGEYPKEVARKGQTTFVGGVSDGLYGMAAFDFVRDGLRARKAWFFFDKEYVALGAGIDNNNDYPVVTTINQSRLYGTVVAKRAGETVEIDAKGEHLLADAESVYHDRTAYIFPTPRNAMVTNRQQTGSWRNINKRRPNKPEQADVFTLWLDHGKRPQQSAYEYIVLPNVSLQEAGRYADRPEVTVVRNTHELQAVRNDSLNVAGASFYQPGELEIMNGLRLRVNTACLVLVRMDKKEIVVSVSDPKNEKKIVALEINIDGLEGTNVDPVPDRPGWSRMLFELPSGPWAGSTSTLHALRR